ncbi:hypothetical protein GALL_301340 [mine drainage metagenome]|uniref:Uncharacterized protein n=1 Tax=mine drainage metagenome TaxID=410659 RepID=A0A1J5QXI0_9ZZZZ
MPTAMDLPVMTRSAALRRAATQRERIRIRGVVESSGGGYSGRYRNTWLRIRTVGLTVQLTAATGSPLGAAVSGARVDVVCTLTGLVDVADQIIFASRARLLERTLAAGTPEASGAHRAGWAGSRERWETDGLCSQGSPRGSPP